MEPEVPRRYIFVVTALAPGGTLSVMRQFWKRLAAHGAVEVVSHGPDRLTVDVPTITIGGRFGGPMRFPAVWIYFVRMLIATLKATRNHRGAMILPQDSLATGAAAAVAGRLTGTPVLLMEHGSAMAIRTPYYWRERVVLRRRRDRWTRPMLRASIEFLHHLCVRLVDGALVAGNESEDALAAAGMSHERMSRYHFPVDLDRFRPAEPDERPQNRAALGLPDRPMLVSVSRLTHEKGLDLVIDSLAQLQPSERPLLVLAGDGPLRASLEERAERRQVDVRFMGSLDADAVAELLRAADLFVYAGRQGANTPYAVLEAMASGLAVVATMEPAVHAEMLADGRGSAVPPEDPSAISEAVKRYLELPETGRVAGELARRHIERDHAPEVLDREIADLLARVAARRR